MRAAGLAAMMAGAPLAIPSATRADPLDVDMPRCLEARHAIEQAGVLIFDRLSPHGGSVFFRSVGDVDAVLSCGVGTDPNLSMTLDDWHAKDPLAKAPPRRLFDLFASQGALAMAARPDEIRTMSERCMKAAKADHDGDGEVRKGRLEVDCTFAPDVGGSALLAVSRRADD